MLHTVRFAIARPSQFGGKSLFPPNGTRACERFGKIRSLMVTRAHKRAIRTPAFDGSLTWQVLGGLRWHAALPLEPHLLVGIDGIGKVRCGHADRRGTRWPGKSTPVDHGSAERVLLLPGRAGTVERTALPLGRTDELSVRGRVESAHGLQTKKRAQLSVTEK